LGKNRDGEQEQGEKRFHGKSPLQIEVVRTARWGGAAPYVVTQVRRRSFVSGVQESGA
jgi:hypothetical protein